MKTVQTMLAEADAEVPRISPDEAKGLLGRADVLFLDVREPAEVAASGKVPGAVAVPRGLVEFRADPASKGQVLDTGLWRFTRHPNYFGDACVWWGLSFIAFSAWPGVLTILSPLAMTWLLAKGTGKPLLEKDMASRRPGYADYVRRTSGFVPLPPKKLAHDTAS